MTMGDRVAVLRRGILMQCASPAELYDTPDNLFVAQFIGSPSMNVVTGTVAEAANGGISLAVAGQTINLSGEAAQRLAGLGGRTGSPIAVGIRPEALGGDGDQHLDVSVDLVEMLGSELLVHATVAAPSVRSTDDGVEIGGGSESTIIAKLDPRHRVKAGDRLSLSVDTLRLHAFDMETGAAIGRA